MARKNYFCLHAHFYQPLRGNPITGEVGEEPGAAPYPNWNARITAECYGPNAELGNLESISFNFNETLLAWLERERPAIYQKILEADQHHLQAHDTGNALASSMHHTILPLSRPRDKRTQIAWGKAAFENRFGHPPEGIWLPEMAVDLETLHMVREFGYRFTILSPGQIEEGIESEEETGGPYWVALSDEDRIAVFVRHERFSSDLAFNIGNVGGAGHWARRALAPYRRYAGLLTLVAVDGETFGHHHKGEYQFVRWLMAYEAAMAGYKITTLNRFLQDHPPTKAVKIKERSAWSCYHGLARWATGCACTPGQSYWKGAFRRALDNLAREIDFLYIRLTEQVGADPWALRDGYIDVLLENISAPDYLRQSGLSLDHDEETRLLKMLRAQYHAQVMFTSCAFFFEDLDRPEPRYAIANAAYAVHLVHEAAGIDLSPGLRRELAIAHSSDMEVNGMELYDRFVQTLKQQELAA